MSSNSSLLSVGAPTSVALPDRAARGADSTVTGSAATTPDDSFRSTLAKVVVAASAGADSRVLSERSLSGSSAAALPLNISNLELSNVSLLFGAAKDRRAKHTAQTQSGPEFTMIAPVDVEQSSPTGIQFAATSDLNSTVDLSKAIPQGAGAAATAPMATDDPTEAVTGGLNALKTLPGVAFTMHIRPTGSLSAAAPPTKDTAEKQGNNAAAQDNDAPASIGAHSGNSQDVPAAAPGVSTPQIAVLSGSMPVIGWAGHARATSVETPAPSGPKAAVAEVAVDELSNSAKPVHSVQLQLGREGEGRVDVRLVEQAGALSVSVRSSDGSLTRGLQENLPELNARLAAEKYETLTFVPQASSSGSGGSSSQHSSQSGDQSGGRAFSQGGSASGDDRQQSGQSNDPRDQAAAWWRQMAALGKLSSTVSARGQDSQRSSGTNPGSR